MIEYNEDAKALFEEASAAFDLICGLAKNDQSKKIVNGFHGLNNDMQGSNKTAEQQATDFLHFMLEVLTAMIDDPDLRRTLADRKPPQFRQILQLMQRMEELQP